MVWSSNGLSLETMEANVSSITNDSVEYTAYYTIVQLNETDDGRIYQCKVVIDSSLQVAASNNIVLHTTSKYSYILANFTIDSTHTFKVQAYSTLFLIEIMSIRCFSIK